MASDARPKKHGHTAQDWFDKYGAEGEVQRGFCRNCHSHWCPHAAPRIYRERRAAAPQRRRPITVPPPGRVIVTRGQTGGKPGG